MEKKPANGGKPADGEDARGHGPEGDGDVLAQAAHLAHVLLAGEGVDDGAGGEEEQRLEEGVGHQVEDAGGVGADSAGQEHVAELRDGRVGEHALDVVSGRGRCVAAKIAVAAPMMATTPSAKGERSKRVWQRATM